MKFYHLPFDWWGRQFCVSKKGYEGIYVLDPVDLTDYFLKVNLIDFHNVTLVKDSAILDSDCFENALKVLQIEDLNENHCIAYKLPLFLNGKADSSNYEVSDLEVYWHIQYQIYNQIKDLPEGTRISNVAIVPEFKYDNKK